jgi:multidrug efflux pump subunit AcrA (membrane-fusion protein)
MVRHSSARFLAAPRSPNPQHTHQNRPAKPDRTAYPGTYAQVSLEMNQRPDALTVPAAAVGSDGDGNFVSTITNNRFTRLAIKTGLTDNGRIEVTAGLSENTLVVANPRACQR